LLLVLLLSLSGKNYLFLLLPWLSQVKQVYKLHCFLGPIYKLGLNLRGGAAPKPMEGVSTSKFLITTTPMA